MRYILYIFIILINHPLCYAESMAAHTGSLKQANDKSPIDIFSDSLTLYRMENRGEFLGHVIAKQGDMTLISDKMIVWYSENSNSKPDSNEGTEPSTNKIDKIEVTGNVKIVTANESAEGLKGVYEASANTFTLYDNVVLKQKQNIIVGDKLVYNRLTGKSVMTSKSNGNNQGRTKAVLIPE